jgi:hypothetical protein
MKTIKVICGVIINEKNEILITKKEIRSIMENGNFQEEK